MQAKNIAARNFQSQQSRYSCKMPNPNRLFSGSDTDPIAADLGEMSAKLVVESAKKHKLTFSFSVIWRTCLIYAKQHWKWSGFDGDIVPWRCRRRTRNPSDDEMVCWLFSNQIAVIWPNERKDHWAVQEAGNEFLNRINDLMKVKPPIKTHQLPQPFLDQSPQFCWHFAKWKADGQWSAWSFPQRPFVKRSAPTPPIPHPMLKEIHIKKMHIIIILAINLKWLRPKAKCQGLSQWLEQWRFAVSGRLTIAFLHFRLPLSNPKKASSCIHKI